MSDSSANGQTKSRRPKGRPRPGLRTMFAGYYLPSDEDVRAFVTDGLVVLDANALLDVYRFTASARKEYLQVLDRLGDRLFVPHRSAEEFFNRRTTVMRSHRAERAKFESELQAAMAVTTSYVVDYCRRRGLSVEHTDEITAQFDSARESALEAFDDAGDPASSHSDTDEDPGKDPILAEVDAVIAGRVGPKFTTEQLAHHQREGQKRITAKLPPGYADEKKGDRVIGDYFVWEQALQKAEKAELPVLMVTNENKEDWVRRDGDYVGPRPELVAEMYERTKQSMHLVDVPSFLALAKQHLSADVSDDTVDEAGRLADVSANPTAPSVDLSGFFESAAGKRLVSEMAADIGQDALARLDFGLRAAAGSMLTAALPSEVVAKMFSASAARVAGLDLLTSGLELGKGITDVYQVGQARPTRRAVSPAENTSDDDTRS